MQVVHVDLYVSDRFTGWREHALVNLSQLYNHQSRSFPADVSQQMVTRVSCMLPQKYNKCLLTNLAHLKHAL